MTKHSPVLMQVLCDITDNRQERGKRHSLSAILALSIAAMLCGYRSYHAMAEWGRNYGTEFLAALGFTKGVAPCAATFFNVYRRLNQAELETKLGQWAEGLIQLTQEESPQVEQVCLDGKTLRGSRKQGARAAHLLSALGQRLGMTLAQVAVDEKTNEIGVVLDLLKELMLKGKVVTCDALLTQREVAHTVTDQGGDYVMIVKGNQPTLLADISDIFKDRECFSGEVSATIDEGHGRIEERSLSVTQALTGYSDWPGMQQVFEVERKVTIKKSGQYRVETVYGVTSLGAEKADAKTLLEIVRRHWTIENQSHWVRDVTFDEDRSQVRVGNIPQVMTTLRNTAIGMMRLMGEPNIAAACRRFAAKPWAALAAIGIPSRIK
ncbi:MAG: ISAs1 family transposase [Pyrinomonadaceae bacterium]|nr:ISAs1 family transposase [Pyrinomonadaceae bacterium]